MTATKNLENSNILITGASDGLGKETARMLAARGAHLILHGRNAEKTLQVMQTLQAETGNARIEIILADFSSLAQVRRMAAEIQSRYSRLDVLVNNAGLYCPKRLLTEDGFEMTFAVNYLAPFLLTNLLTPLLISSAPARIVNLSSLAHRLVWLNKNDLQGTKFFWDWVAYSQSKLLLILFSNYLAKQIEQSQVTTNALHPGIIPGTNVLRNGWIKCFSTREMGARTIVNLATNPELEGITGAYFSKFKQVKPNPIAENIELQEKLWQQSLAWTGLAVQD